MFDGCIFNNAEYAPSHTLYCPQDSILKLKLQWYHQKFKISTRRLGSWLRHCATSWKVAGSIPFGVTGIFHST